MERRGESKNKEGEGKEKQETGVRLAKEKERVSKRGEKHIFLYSVPFCCGSKINYGREFGLKGTEGRLKI